MDRRFRWVSDGDALLLLLLSVVTALNGAVIDLATLRAKVYRLPNKRDDGEVVLASADVGDCWSDRSGLRVLL